MPNTKNQQSPEYINSEKEKIRYGKCIGCPDLGPCCGAGNLLNLTITELRAWLKLWRLFYGLSIEQCAAIWDTPFGTAARVLSETESDFKYGTMQHIISKIVNYGVPAGQELSDSPCPATSSDIRKQFEKWNEILAEKEKECEDLRKKMTDKDEAYIEQMAIQRQAHNEERTVRERSIAFLRDLAEKRLGDLEKEELQSKDYLARIDEKNIILEDRMAEIRRLNQAVIDLQTQRVTDLETANAQLEALRKDHRRDRRSGRVKLGIVLGILAAVTAMLICYLVWDLLHQNMGFFIY